MAHLTRPPVINPRTRRTRHHRPAHGAHHITAPMGGGSNPCLADGNYRACCGVTEIRKEGAGCRPPKGKPA